MLKLCSCGHSRNAHTVKQLDDERLACGQCDCKGFDPVTVEKAKRTEKAADRAAMDRETPALYDRSGGRCEAAIPGVCTGRGQHRHHRQRRRGGDHSTANLLHLCRACHAWTHQSGKGRVCGLLVRTDADPAAIPVDTTVEFHEEGRRWQPK